MDRTFDGRREIYAHAWHDMVIDADRVGAMRAAAHKIVAGRSRYEEVSARTGVPWTVIGLAHLRESDCNFETHLHNGDSLRAKTHHVPAGRPPGEPPFRFEDSACDALHLDGLDKFSWDSIERIAFALEMFNGFGYAQHGLPSAYLWAGTNQYRGGKYVADNVFDPHAVDRQLGTMGVLKMIEEAVPGCLPAATHPAEVLLGSPKAGKVDDDAVTGALAGGWSGATSAVGDGQHPIDQGDGTPPKVPSYFSVAYRSRTVNAIMVFLAAIFGWLGDMLHRLWDSISGLFDVFPQIADSVRQNLSMGEEVASWFALNWHAIETTVAGVSIVVALALLLHDKRKAQTQ